ncbi:MAG: transcriptional repressor [Alistipes sp.]|jgi:Fur family ferric uptake transcriptional regulator/Fur family peroxide stress response transcriptional regulator|nr:transcriptional repressor [Alistipes sp.]
MYKKAQEKLSEHDIRPSLQRLSVMDFLLKNRTHPTADDIYTALAPQIPGLSRTTVFNTVSLLSKHGAILSLDLDGGRTHYDGDTSPHAHFLCTRCGMIHDIGLGDDFVQNYSVPALPGAAVTDVQLNYKGLCAECVQKTIEKLGNN